MQNHHLVPYGSRYGNSFVFYSPQLPTFKNTKYGLLYHDMMHLLKNKKNAHIMVNNSHYFIKRAEEKKKQYTARDVKITDSERLF